MRRRVRMPGCCPRARERRKHKHDCHCRRVASRGWAWRRTCGARAAQTCSATAAACRRREPPPGAGAPLVHRGTAGWAPARYRERRCPIQRGLEVRRGAILRGSDCSPDLLPSRRPARRKPRPTSFARLCCSRRQPPASAVALRSLHGGGRTAWWEATAPAGHPAPLVQAVQPHQGRGQTSAPQHR